MGPENLKRGGQLPARLFIGGNMDYPIYYKEDYAEDFRPYSDDDDDEPDADFCRAHVKRCCGNCKFFEQSRGAVADGSCWEYSGIPKTANESGLLDGGSVYLGTHIDAVPEIIGCVNFDPSNAALEEFRHNY